MFRLTFWQVFINLGKSAFPGLLPLACSIGSMQLGSFTEEKQIFFSRVEIRPFSDSSLKTTSFLLQLLTWTPKARLSFWPLKIFAFYWWKNNFPFHFFCHGRKANVDIFENSIICLSSVKKVHTNSRYSLQKKSKSTHLKVSLFNKIMMVLTLTCYLGSCNIWVCINPCLRLKGRWGGKNLPF